MSKQRTFFTEEQMASLRQNPYVYSVTQGTLTLTKEFKEIFYAEYQRGILPRNILEQHGFDLNALGTHRIWSISQHIRDEYNILSAKPRQKAQKSPETLENTSFLRISRLFIKYSFSEARGNRTRDNLIKSQVLYRLS